MPQSNILYPFREADLLQIEQTLYEPKQYIPSVRDIFSKNTSFSPGLAEYGYDIYKRTGSAGISSRMPDAKDIQNVGEIMSRVTFKPFYISSMYQYTREERLAMATQQQFGKGAYFPLDVKRIEAVRRFIDEQENQAFYKGVSSLGITGLFNFSDGTSSISPQAVAEGSVGASSLLKKKWSNKSGQEIIADLITAKKTASKNGLYNPDTLLLSVDSAFELQKPYSSQASTPIIQWLTGESGMFKTIKTIKECSKAYNGIAPTYDSNAGTEAFVVFENNSNIIELAVIEDLTLLNGIYDETETYRQVAVLKSGGAIIRYPEAIYIGRDI
jgi:hypothetical protein